LRADQEALANDLALAQELAADFRSQVADKANEVAHLKRLLEQTQANLVRFGKDIAELRAERHRLANEAMKAAAYEMQAKRLAAECERLRTENAELRRQPVVTPGSTEERLDALARTVERLRAAIDPTEAVAPRPARAPSAGRPKEEFIDIAFER
jgi:chromosome segregation ATPase